MGFRLLHHKQSDWRGQEAVDEKALPSFFASLQSPDRPLFIPCAEQARPLFLIYHTHKKKQRGVLLRCARARVLVLLLI